MKIIGMCPKCHSNDIVRINGTVGAYGAGNNIQLGATIFSAVKVNRYICCSCGFTEEWIDSDELEKIKYSSKAMWVG